MQKDCPSHMPFQKGGGRRRHLSFWGADILQLMIGFLTVCLLELVNFYVKNVLWGEIVMLKRSVFFSIYWQPVAHNRWLLRRLAVGSVRIKTMRALLWSTQLDISTRNLDNLHYLLIITGRGGQLQVLNLFAKCSVQLWGWQTFKELWESDFEIKRYGI